jgi:hypothetical protein
MARIRTNVRTLQLGLAADLTWHFDRSVLGYRSTIRARTRYLVFCSSWTILSGILLAMVLTMADTVGGSMTQVVVYARKFLLSRFGHGLIQNNQDVHIHVFLAPRCGSLHVRDRRKRSQLQASNLLLCGVCQFSLPILQRWTPLLQYR